MTTSTKRPDGGELTLGPFNHHPDPAIDFCIEVEVIEAEWLNIRHGFTNGTPPRSEIVERLTKAMRFRVGGDQCAVNAKTMLRKIEAEMSATPTNESPAPQATFGCKRAGGFVDHNCMAMCDCDKTMRFAAPQPPVEGLREELSDPNIVHLNMLRGDIAKPTREQIKHLYPELFSSDPAIITDFDRFYGDPVERFKAMADANHEGPIDVAHFKMWCRIAEREIRHARAPASPSLTAGASSELRRVWLDRLNAIAPAVENLAGHQEQCDFDGVRVKVSRQALDEVLNVVNDLAVSFVTAPATLTEQPSEAPLSAPDVREAIARADVRRIVKGLINDGELPEYETQDDNGLEAGEYVDLFFEILDLLSAQPAKGER